MSFGRCQILTDCDAVYLVKTQVLQYLHNLFVCLAQSEHETAFGGNVRVLLGKRFEQRQGAFV